MRLGWPALSVKMSDYSGFGSNYGNRGSSGTPDKQKIMEQVRNQIALASAQELIQVLCLCKLCVKFMFPDHEATPIYFMSRKKMSDKCFRKCIYYPGSQLDTKEQKCLTMCMERYMEAWNITSRTYNNRLQKEHSSLK